MSTREGLQKDVHERGIVRWRCSVGVSNIYEALGLGGVVRYTLTPPSLRSGTLSRSRERGDREQEHHVGVLQRLSGLYGGAKSLRLTAKALEFNPFANLCREFPSREILTLDTNRGKS